MKGTRLGQELGEIYEELQKANALTGKDRSMKSDTERCRARVGSGIKRALRLIEGEHAPLFKHLDESLKGPTGLSPVYTPSKTVIWGLD